MTPLVLPHVDFARELLDDLTADLPYPLVRRAQVAALPAVPAQSVIEVPAYLIDLGLRRWRDPALLFRGSLERNPGLVERWATLREKQPAAFDACVRAWEAGKKTSEEVSADLETLLVLTGDNDAALSLARGVGAAVRSVDHARLAVGVATMCSLDDPTRSLQLLDEALDLVKAPGGAFFIHLRRLALFIKRLGDLGAAHRLFAELWRGAIEAQRDFVVSDADASGMHALLLNLRALIEVKKEDYSAALRTMEEAEVIMPDDGFVVINTDMADRYRAQVRVNAVQTLWLTGQARRALQRINAHVTITRAEHPYSLSEALLVAAYLCFLGGEHAMSLSYCMEAERLVAAEGTPTRLAMCRRIAVGALSKLGKTRRAEILARQLVKDPLGDHRLV
ncbi:MAG: hypothetical protein FWD59_02440 [Micrococcales bacterium]|nr:hypothetical protein [Micrococcales bacterium]